jgi:hypothetical protein
MHFALSLILLLVSFNSHGIGVRSTLQYLSNEEQADLYFVFSSLAKDHFFYTLFGDKPISLAGRFTLTPWETQLKVCLVMVHSGKSGKHGKNTSICFH